MCASQVHAVVGIERDLTRDALHDTGQAAIADGVFICLVRQVDCKREGNPIFRIAGAVA